jgi:hypothetical protein
MGTIFESGGESVEPTERSTARIAPEHTGILTGSSLNPLDRSCRSDDGDLVRWRCGCLKIATLLRNMIGIAREMILDISFTVPS